MNLVTYLRNGFLKFFGDIKIFKFPFFLLYDPGSYKVKGSEVRFVIDSLQKGDILVRGYSNYLDGVFIPGFFSHTGLYLGQTRETDLMLPDVIKEKFYEGKQAVIHAMAEGVFMEDILTFCKCDYLVVLRRNAKTEPNFDLDKSFDVVYNKALKNLGKGYDFQFDFSDIGNLSCTELVYVCNEQHMAEYLVKIKERRVLFKKRQVLLPDDFITENFDIVFTSKSVKPSIMEKILRENNNQ
ncbi:MAG TPA: hypothetical protein DD827_03820 [Gammaproteobacteria bacterium]|jgi:hypothetical protein|nr:hypothetical protein [Gammaproteobacteria bacterium]